MKRLLVLLVGVLALTGAAFAGTARAASTPPPPPPAVHTPSHSFLCYSTYQTDPGVWENSQAITLLGQGYWIPYAIKGNVTGGTNIGGYHLVCNLATGQAAGQQFAGADGFVPGVGSYPALKGVVGWYPIVP